MWALAPILAFSVLKAEGFEIYGKEYPNGNISQFNFLGHPDNRSPDDGGRSSRSNFGLDYARNRNWAALCFLDSDNDGKTNGEELGDPECKWRKGDPDVVCRAPSDPRDPNQASDCGGADTIGGDVTTISTKLDAATERHVILMMVTFLFLMPVGIYLMVLRRAVSHISPLAQERITFVHRVFGLGSIALMIGGIFGSYSFSEFNTLHGWFGLVLMICSILMPFLIDNAVVNVIDDLVKLPILWYSIRSFLHYWLGRAILVLGWVVMFLGYDRLKVRAPEWERNSLVLVCLIVLCLAWAIALLATYFLVLKRDSIEKKAFKEAVGGAALRAKSGVTRPSVLKA